MLNFAMIGRHMPTQEQIVMAQHMGIELTNVGDIDAFKQPLLKLLSHKPYDGIITANFAIALRAIPFLIYHRRPCAIGVWENGQRPDANGKATFFPVALHVYDVIRDDADGVFIETETVQTRGGRDYWNFCGVKRWCDTGEAFNFYHNV